jgi:hypothetical protein
MPRETTAFVLVLGQAAALTWGLVSLEIWTLNERAPAALIAPLIATAFVSQWTGLEPVVAASVVCGAAGLLASALLLAVARAGGA